MANKKYITVSWKAGREPVDDMFWCEAEFDGAWTSITKIDRLRTRREIIERIAELDQAIVGFDFAFSFPKAFIDFLHTEGINNGWLPLAKKIREDLKKNTDDGVRIWIEQMGKYREAHLEPLEEAHQRKYSPSGRDGRRNFRPEALHPYERRSVAERFRRIGLILKRKNPGELESTLGIGYNRLTSRYEFGDPDSRGRSALLGISMLEQLAEMNPEIAIWPFMKPAAVTVAEIYPKIFADKLPNDPNALRKFFDIEEDNALFVSREVRDLVFSNPQAHDIFFALIGIIKAERREDKTVRPLRDYRDYFYDNEEIKTEGWVYGIGFKEPEKQQREIVHIAGKAQESSDISEKTETEVPLEMTSETST